MQTATKQIHDPARARAYFENEVAFTTDPIELEHEPLNRMKGSGMRDRG